jgi:hypothetical protein
MTTRNTWTTCDKIVEEIFLGRAVDDTAAAHVRRCERCSQEEPVMRALAHVLGADVAPELPPGLTNRVLSAVAPVLAERAVAAREPYRQSLVRALAVALLPLPVILLLDLYLVRAIHTVLSAVLPAALSTYLTFNYAALVVVLITLTYGSIPLLADRQLRLARRQERYA